jgi:archaellum biogenesis ATPase FlaH
MVSAQNKVEERHQRAFEAFLVSFRNIRDHQRVVVERLKGEVLSEVVLVRVSDRSNSGEGLLHVRLWTFA